MDNQHKFPGTAEHQAVLGVVYDLYSTDPKLRALILFGSLSGGEWDPFSDLDLDVITQDDCRLDLHAELLSFEHFLEDNGYPVALAFPDGDDSIELVLASLMQLSVRYHHLQDTSPAIIHRFQVLAGELQPEAIVAAGLANRQVAKEPLRLLVDQSLRELVVLRTAIQRRRRWLALELLGRLRQRTLEIFTQAHEGQRAFYYFEREAGPALQKKAMELVCKPDWQSISRAYLAARELFESGLSELTHDQVQLRPGDLLLLHKLSE